MNQAIVPFICNAVITKAEVSLDHDSFLTCWLFLEYGDGFHQGFGGYTLGGVPGTAVGKHVDQPNLAADYLVSVLRAADVENFNLIPGKTIRVKRSSEGFGGDILAIGHIIKDDLWFEPRVRLAEMIDAYKARGDE